MHWFYFLLRRLIPSSKKNQMNAIQKLRSTTPQLENHLSCHICLSGALELEHLERPEDMVMDPARAKLQALGMSASPTQDRLHQVLYLSHV